MQSFRSPRSLFFLPQCVMRVMVKRNFSFFMKRGGSKKHTTQSGLFSASEKQTEIQPKKFFKTNGRLLITNAPKGEEVLANESDVENRNGTRNGRPDRSFEASEDFDYVKSLTVNPVLKEENLNLFWKLSKGDKYLFNELRTWQMRVNIMLTAVGASNTITEEKWAEFLKISGRQKERFFHYLITTSVKKQNIHKNQYIVPCREDDYNDLEDNFNDPMCYHVFHNAMFIAFRPPTFRKLLYRKGMVAVLHGPEIFIDCSYEDYMNRSECKYLARQISEAVKRNLLSDLPYHMILCNFNNDGLTAKYLTKNSPTILQDSHPLTYTSKSYLDFCPREKLIYLSPHCKSVMTTFEPDKRYIIGGFVDKSIQQPISLAKAKENKIEIRKLPIDNHLDWRFGKKVLCVNHVLAVLLSLRHKNDWDEAFDVLPKRYITRTTAERKPHKESGIKIMCEHVLKLGIISTPNENLL